GTAAPRPAGAAAPPVPGRPPPAGSPCGRPSPSRRPAANTGPRRRPGTANPRGRSEEHTSELQSLTNLVCRLLLEKKKNQRKHAGHRVPAHQRPAVPPSRAHPRRPPTARRLHLHASHHFDQTPHA